MLPKPVLCNIFAFLDNRDSLNCVLTCKYIHQIFESDYMWKCKPLPYIAPHTEKKSWKIKHEVYACLKRISKIENCPVHEIYEMSGLSYNPIHKNINHLINLKVIGCISGFPMNLLDISQLTNLTTLHLRNCNLKYLPDLRGSCNLQFLYCAQNILECLPDLSACVNLQIIDCEDNKLTQLPNLSEYVKLRSLYCKNNQLTQLPDLSKLGELTMLDFSRNKLTQMPDLSACVKLLYLHFVDNNFNTTQYAISSLDN
jgi:Leucine-rich repeat (LRR) protein